MDIIAALPALIQIIKDIVDAIEGHPLQALHESTLCTALAAWDSSKDGEKLEADLHAIAAKLASA